MLKISKVAIACNNSSNVDANFKLVIQLANKFNAQIFILFYGQAEPDNLKSKFSGIDYQFELRSNKTYSDLAGRLNSIKPDLLVLNVSNKHTNEGFLSLSDTNKLIDNADKPVLTIPANYQFTNFDKILIPIDTSFETRQKGPATIVFAQKFNSAVSIIGVSTDKSKDSEVKINNYSRQVRNKLAENNIDSTIEVNLGGNITDQTIDYARKINANLVVIMTEQEVNFKSFFTGKFSEQFIKKADFPVLNVNTKDLILSEARL